eukprot:193153-Prorocentrum_minimum.AAC.2
MNVNAYALEWCPPGGRDGGDQRPPHPVALRCHLGACERGQGAGGARRQRQRHEQGRVRALSVRTRALSVLAPALS